MATKTAKNVKALSTEDTKKRLQKMIELKKEYLKRIEDEGYETVLAEIKLMQGNSKTGKNVRTISCIPVHDCPNCSGCAGADGTLCYDLRNDCIYPGVINDRARNSALKEANPKRFWERVSKLVAEEFVNELRINVGGDLKNHEFELVNMVAKNNPACDVLFFTKNYKGINAWLDSTNGNYESNLHPLMSAWVGMEMDNPYNLPVSHVLWADGTTTAPEFGSYYCGGNCSYCHFYKEGCWALKKGESVIFNAH